MSYLGRRRQAYFVFIIDGDYRDGIAFIEELTTNPGFKVLVSSRPIPDCAAAFDSMPRLQLHHLTHDDITAYVHDVVLNKRPEHLHPAPGYLMEGAGWGVRADLRDPKARDHMFWKMQTFLETPQISFPFAI